MSRLAGVHHGFAPKSAFGDRLAILRPAVWAHAHPVAPLRLRLPRLSRVGGLAVALVLAVAATSVVVPARVAAKAAVARNAAVHQALGDGRAVATAIETYALEYGAFPRAISAIALADALQPFLASAALTAAARSPFLYRLTPTGYRLDFTPGSGVPVTVEVTAGTGGMASAGPAHTPIPW